MAEQEPPEPEVRAAVEAWRKQHGLCEDDPVLLLVGLFHIYFQHRDKSRCQDPPSPQGSESFTTLTGAALASIEEKLNVLIQGISKSATDAKRDELKAWVAILAVILGAFGGFVLGRFWP